MMSEDFSRAKVSSTTSEIHGIKILLNPIRPGEGLRRPDDQTHS